jgi:hypothetical protein
LGISDGWLNLTGINTTTLSPELDAAPFTVKLPAKLS